MRRPGLGAVAAGVLLLALVLAGVVSRFASGDPDGLTKVAEDHGFADAGSTRHGLLGGYGSLTGALGVLVVLALAGGLAYAVRRSPARDAASDEARDDARDDARDGATDEERTP